MHEELEQLDDELAHLAQSVRGGDYIHACLELAEFAVKLDCYIQREERALLPVRAPTVMAIVRREHARLRQLIAAIAQAFDRADDDGGLQTLGMLRSVLLVHALKEERLLASHGRVLH